MAITDEQRAQISTDPTVQVSENGDGTLTVTATAVATQMAGAGE